MQNSEDNKTASFTRHETDEGLIIELKGCWVLENAKKLPHMLDTAADDLGDASAIIFDGSELDKIDTSGAIVVHDKLKDLEETGIPIRFRNLEEKHSRYFQMLENTNPQKEKVHTPEITTVYLLNRLGEASVNLLFLIRDLLHYFGQICVEIVKSILNPSQFRLRSVVRHVHEAGIDALPIVMLMAFLISIVLAYQGVVQLRAFGAEIFTVNLTAISILREMGVLLTAIMVAGRSGSAFAAEIGVMKLNEEVDAMNTMGLNPMQILVLPRICALVIVLPVLTFFADIAGLIGGAFSIALLVDIPLERFIEQTRNGITVWTFLTGMIKAPFFGFLIAFVATHCGMMVKGSAESVGNMTTSSVVKAIFLVIFADALFSMLFVKLGI
ncbi:MAG: ABC transporter permease [Alphaproteobacteria bacterium]|nr:ABC transporter permease [Alphaproteobacteria bacterium]|tara:strand:+ start:534 stop:1685 length:1152 start_codon:yes stop_codon:yes gene_type:complete